MSNPDAGTTQLRVACQRCESRTGANYCSTCGRPLRHSPHTVGGIVHDLVVAPLHEVWRWIAATLYMLLSPTDFFRQVLLDERPEDPDMPALRPHGVPSPAAYAAFTVGGWVLAFSVESLKVGQPEIKLSFFTQGSAPFILQPLLLLALVVIATVRWVVISLMAKSYMPAGDAAGFCIYSTCLTPAVALLLLLLLTPFDQRSGAPYFFWNFFVVLALISSAISAPVRVLPKLYEVPTFWAVIIAVASAFAAGYAGDLMGL